MSNFHENIKNNQFLAKMLLKIHSKTILSSYEVPIDAKSIFFAKNF